MAGSAGLVWLTAMLIMSLVIGGGIMGLSQTDKLNPITSSAAATQKLAEASITQADAQRKYIENADYERSLDEQHRAHIAQQQEAQRQDRGTYNAKMQRYQQVTSALPALLTILASAMAVVALGLGAKMLGLLAPRKMPSSVPSQERTWLQEERRRLEIKERWLAQQAEEQQKQLLQMQQQSHAMKLQLRELRHANMRRDALQAQRNAAQPGSPVAASPSKVIPGPGNPQWRGKTDGGTTGSTGSTQID